jgi:hypothetical protein
MSKKLNFAVATATRTQGDCPGLSWYFWSSWGLNRLREIVALREGEFTLPRAIGHARGIARVAMRDLGALIPGKTDASPYQPGIADLIDLVLAFRLDGARWVCRVLSRLARRVVRYCETSGVWYAMPWNTQYSNLTDCRCAFRVLVAAAAEMIRSGEAKELRKLLKAEDAFALIARAIKVDPYGEPCAPEVGMRFVASLKEGVDVSLYEGYGYEVAFHKATEDC